jgi:CBS domain-containing membrane protein
VTAVPNLRVRDLMTADVLTVRPEDSLATLRDLMDDAHIRHVPVVAEDGSLAGLVSERDLLRRASTADADIPVSVQADVFAGVSVREIMTWDVETTESDENVATAAQIMLDNKYGCLPVVDGGALVGILTEADCVRFMAGSGEAHEPRPGAGARRAR